MTVILLDGIPASRSMAFLSQAYTSTFFHILIEAPCRDRTRDFLSTNQVLYQHELMGRL